MRNKIFYALVVSAIFLIGVIPQDAYAGTFGYATGTNYGVQSGVGTTTCLNSGHLDNGNLGEITRHTTSGGRCETFSTEWDISLIPDNANVTSVKIRLDIDDQANEPCAVWSIELRPSTSAVGARWADNINGTKYINNDAFCQTVGDDVVLDLGASAISDIETALGSSQDWWGTGFAMESMVPTTGHRDYVFTEVELEVVYTAEIVPITDLNCVFVADPDDYSVDCDWTNPTGDGLDGFNIQRNNGTAWEVLINNTATTVNFYNDTGLHQSLFHMYNVTGWGDLNQGGGSNIQNTTTIDPVNATVVTIPTVVGNIIGPNAIVTAIAAFPDAQEIDQVRTWLNGTLVDTDALSQTWQNFTVIPHYTQINANTTAKQDIRIINFTGDSLLFESDTVWNVKEYEPDYFTAIEAGHQVNYTVSRDVTQTDLNLKVNRDPINFKIECLYQDPIQAVTGNLTNGIWTNKTNVGFLDDHVGVDASDNIYITCYNDELLFTTTSYTNSSQTLLAIGIYDNIYGEFLGVPVGIFFLILVAGYANQRTAPTWTVILLAMAGILATVGFFTLDTAVWGLMLIAGMLGLLVGRKVF